MPMAQEICSEPGCRVILQADGRTIEKAKENLARKVSDHMWNEHGISK